MKDVFESITTYLKERLSSTFILNYLASWVVFNWQFVYVSVFYPEKGFEGMDKYTFIAVHNFNDFEKCKPLLLALAITFGVPVVNAVVKLFVYFVQKVKTRIELFQIDKRLHVSPKDYTRVRLSLLNTEKRFHTSILKQDDLKIQLRDLKSKEKNFLTELDGLKKTLENQDQEKSEISLLFAKTKNQLSEILSKVELPTYLLGKRLYCRYIGELYIEYNPVDFIQIDVNKVLIAGNVLKIKSVYTNGLICFVTTDSSSGPNVFLFQKNNNDDPKFTGFVTIYDFGAVFNRQTNSPMKYQVD